MVSFLISGLGKYFHIKIRKYETTCDFLALFSVQLLETFHSLYTYTCENQTNICKELASYGEKSEYVKEKNIPFTYTNFLANLPRKQKKHRNLMAVTLTPNFYLATFQDLPVQLSVNLNQLIPLFILANNFAHVLPFVYIFTRPDWLCWVDLEMKTRQSIFFSSGFKCSIFTR